ncbi:alpha-galactosidase [Mobilitalea sibirica]|uniref:Alpha-galactosidase n=1 Tax=Mobilitalea sibirica TaxID=1462919 RepID=A0A8J7H123_9FIRM|nr:alpha-galactosidase [Mobilitalea sibirica]MBH1939932.1 alpha-galactosidase [Mobilitalea sibirica]
MSIFFDEKQKVFKLDTPNTSYCMGVADHFGYLIHIYYGKKLKGSDITFNLPMLSAKNKTWFMDSVWMEYPTGGIGDFREHCLEIRTEEGYNSLEIGYISHVIYEGKPKLEGLPATYADEKSCKTLEITMHDPIIKLDIILIYTVFNDIDIITRSVKIKNTSEKPVYLTKVLSACLDMPYKEFEMLTLHGSWARERHIQTKKIGYGRQGVFSERGETGQQDHPFLALTTPGTSQTMGEVYAMHFVYSGNFETQCEVTQLNSVRMVMGINPYHFCWKLNENEVFTAPEVVMVYSGEGLGGMTRNLHNLYRKHLIRGKYKNKKRPILINNWEATYFDFDTDKLLSIAKQASELGIEMLVVDDGWFGNRFDDNRSLGDWFVNEEKIKGGLKYLVDEVNKLGMKFGMWFEPEMVSPDSDLYREHPDWAIQVPDRAPGLVRNQLVLDLTRREVLEHTYESIAKVLRSANVEYVKWDMNRPLTDLGSLGLPSDRQGELYHRYMLAVYELQERLMNEFPNLLLENCSSGGARFDPGMLYYSPQIWCSDDTDAIERLAILEGTALIYPLSTIGAHVSDCPNHVTGRTTPFDTRGIVALAGTFGYELDVTKISEDDRKAIPKQVEMYHKYNDLVREGDYYRIASFKSNHYYDCYEVVSKDKKEAIVTFVQVLTRASYPMPSILLQGLDPDTKYRIDASDMAVSGDVLMYMGFPIEMERGDYQARIYHLTAVE